MPDRKYQAANYRFGFNGKENDNDVKGFGNEQDYGMRIYDPRLGKFLSLDPLTKKYPELTPYQFASNKPIKYVDVDGAEAEGDEDLELNTEEWWEAYENRGKDEAARALKEDSREEQLKREREAEQYSRRLGRGWRNYTGNAFASMEELYRPEEEVDHPFKQYLRQKQQFAINQQNARTFEKVVETQLRATNNKVANQVTLLVSGRSNGKQVEVRIRIDNVTVNNGVIDLHEAKYSIETISSGNYTRTLTTNQQKAFDLFTNGTNVNIFVRGENGRLAGLSPGENITGKVSEIKVIVNSTQNPAASQTQTVKTINVPGSSSFKQQKHG